MLTLSLLAKKIQQTLEKKFAQFYKNAIKEFFFFYSKKCVNSQNPCTTKFSEVFLDFSPRNNCNVASEVVIFSVHRFAVRLMRVDLKPCDYYAKISRSFLSRESIVCEVFGKPPRESNDKIIIRLMGCGSCLSSLKPKPSIFQRRK